MPWVGSCLLDRSRVQAMHLHATAARVHDVAWSEFSYRHRRGLDERLVAP
jgi:hypothetical protein